MILDRNNLLGTEFWQDSGDGFSLYLRPLSDILLSMGIVDTGLSKTNHADVISFFDDWHLYRIAGKRTVYSLLKLREQERDYIPGFSDKDDASITVSFVPFDCSSLEALSFDSTVDSENMNRFLDQFRKVTQLPNQVHSPELRSYFADPRHTGSYLIAEAYIRKLISLAPNGIIPFPDGMHNPPERIIEGLEALNRSAERLICDWKDRCIRLADPSQPTLTEKQAILAAHTGNLTENSFAAEVKFHADALEQWQARIPYLGKRRWYASAIRADMQLERDSWFRFTFFSPYLHPNSSLVREQQVLHGSK